MNGRAGFGRTYGATVEAAVEAAARGGVLGQVGFGSNEDAVGAVVSFERLRRVLARHVRLLVGPAWPNEPGGHDLVADELARALEAAVRPVVSGPLQEFAGRHPAEQAWRTSADALGLAHDILASHLDPDRVPLTPDGELALRPEAAWPALVRLADLALTLDGQRDCLVRRLVDAARAGALSGLPSVHVARLGTARVQRAAAKVIDAGQSRPGWLALDELAPAPLKSAILLPEDPLVRSPSEPSSARNSWAKVWLVSALAVCGGVRVAFSSGSRQTQEAKADSGLKSSLEEGGSGLYVRLHEESRHGHKAETMCRNMWVCTLRGS